MAKSAILIVGVFLLIFLYEITLSAHYRTKWRTPLIRRVLGLICKLDLTLSHLQANINLSSVTSAVLASAV